MSDVTRASPSLPPGFEMFTRPASRVRSARTPEIAIDKAGAFNINRAAFELLGEPRFVVLLFAPEGKVVALRSTTEGDPNAYAVHGVASFKGGAPSQWRVSAAAFLNYQDIRQTQSRRWVARAYGDGVVGISLSTPPVELRYHRAASKTDAEELLTDR